MCTRNDISWVPGARQPVGMSGCSKNDSPPLREMGERGGGFIVKAGPTMPAPSLKRTEIILSHGDEGEDYGPCARKVVTRKVSLISTVAGVEFYQVHGTLTATLEDVIQSFNPSCALTLAF